MGDMKMAQFWKMPLAVGAALIVLGGCASSSPRAVFSTGGNVAQDFGSSSYNLGKQYMAAGQYGLAVHEFQIAHARDPNSVEVLNGLAATYDNLGRFDLAERYYREALDLNPMSAQTLNNIGYSYLLRGKYDLAVMFLRDASNTENENGVVVANHQAAVDALVGGEPPLPQIADAAAPAGISVPEAPAFIPHIERVAESVQSLVTQQNAAESVEDGAAPIRPVRVVYRTEELLLPEDNYQQPVADTPIDATEAQIPASQLPAPVAQAARTFPFAARTPTARERATSVTPRRRDSVARPLQVAQRMAPMTVSTQAPAQILEADAAPATLLAGLPMTRMRSNEGADLAANGSPLPLVARLTETTQDPKATTRPITLLAARGDVMDIEVEPAARVYEPQEPLMLLAARQFDGLLTVRQPQDSIYVDEGDITSIFDMAGTFVEVTNGTGRRRMAARLRGYLESLGINVAQLSNANHYSHFETTIFYKTGSHDAAKDVSYLLPAFVDLAADDDMQSDVRIELGGDLLNFDYHIYMSDLKPGNGHAG